MRIIVGLLLAGVACAGVVVSAACSNQEGVATRVATDWVTESAEAVTEEFVRLTTGDIPLVGQLARSVLEDQLRDSVTWEFSTPECASDDECDLIATATVRVGFSLPFEGNKVYAASLPFDLRVDTERREVTRWTPDVAAASVREVR